MRFKLDENLPFLFRPPSTGRQTVFDFVSQNLKKILDLELRGRLVVVSGTGVRTR